MALGAQLPVRLETDVEERLEAVAQQVGTTKSALIRLLARTFVDEFVDDKGRVSLPPNWKSLAGLSDADERSRPSSDKKKVVNLLPDPTLPPKIKSAADVLERKLVNKNRRQRKSKTSA
jgi:predicted DNA-binding protein